MCLYQGSLFHTLSTLCSIKTTINLHLKQRLVIMRSTEKSTTTAVRAVLYRIADKRSTATKCKEGTEKIKRERSRVRTESRGQTRHNPRLPSPEDFNWGRGSLGTLAGQLWQQGTRGGRRGRGLRAVCHLVVFAVAIVVIALIVPFFFVARLATFFVQLFGLGLNQNSWFR